MCPKAVHATSTTGTRDVPYGGSDSVVARSSITTTRARGPQRDMVGDAKL